MRELKLTQIDIQKIWFGFFFVVMSLNPRFVDLVSRQLFSIIDHEMVIDGKLNITYMILHLHLNSIEHTFASNVYDNNLSSLENVLSVHCSVN